jgi:site-specific DNA recombinase
VLVQDEYSDNGCSGATLERPALKRLLADIEAGQVDVVVVYKIDRLSRSLIDFARFVEVFDRHDVTFVSVTQSYNSTTSMGRLTLNILLSFAQLEREVLGECIRDKFAASRARGMWMGGSVSLGYDARDRKLVVNEVEAATVRRIFTGFAEIGSGTKLTKVLRAEGVTTKRGKPIKSRIGQALCQPHVVVRVGFVPRAPPRVRPKGWRSFGYPIEHCILARSTPVYDGG